MNNEESLENSFWGAINSIPGKARHDGFQMTVVGRFGKRWQNILLNIIT